MWRSQVCTARLSFPLAALAAVLVLASTWSASASATRRDAEQIRNRPNFSTVAQDIYGDWASPLLLVARSECEWTVAMARLAAQGALIVLPGPKAPECPGSSNCPHPPSP